MNVSEFNPVNLLGSNEEIAEYLAEAYLDEDPNVFVVALGNVVKHRGLAEVALDTGLNRESLYKTFSGRVQPKWDTIHRLMKSLDLNLEITA